MPGAVILADQPNGVGQGTPGQAGWDFWQSHPIDLSCATQGNLTYSWTLLTKPRGSAAVLTGSQSPTTSFTPDLVGTYRIQLITNNGGPGNIQTLVYRCRYDNTGVIAQRGWAYPAFGEVEGESNYIDGQTPNTRGWAQMIEWIFEDIRNNFGTGGSPSFSTVTLANLSPNQIVKTDGSKMLVSAATIAASEVAAGTNGYFLKSVGGVSTWATVPGGVALSASAPSQVSNVAASAGVSADAAPVDHIHSVLTAAPATLSASTTVLGAGSGTALALANHVHTFTVPSQTTGDLLYFNGTSWARLAIGTNGQALTVSGGALTWGAGGGGASLTAAAPANVTKAAAAVGVATDAARADHKHDITTATASSLSVGGSNTEGSATSLARSDHTHALPAFGTTGGTFAQGNDSRFVSAYGSTPAALGTTGATSGASAAFAKGDHVHNVNVAAPIALDVALAAVSAGVSTSLARADHAHTLTVASQATGDLLYASSATVWTRLAVGTNGHVLTLVGGLPAWTAAGGGTLAGDVTGAAGSNIVEKLTGVSNYVKFPAGHTTARIGQAQATSGNGQPIIFSAQASFGTGVTNGGTATLVGGGKNSTGLKGGAILALGVTDTTREPMVEVAEKVTGNCVTALNYLRPITSTDAPSGVGSGVTLIANATTVPSANPGAGGVTVYLEQNVGLWLRDGDGNEVMLAPVVTS